MIEDVENSFDSHLLRHEIISMLCMVYEEHVFGTYSSRMTIY
jgi:hypothetical protein